MDRSLNSSGKIVVATALATALLASAFVSATPSSPGSPAGQDVAKVEIKVALPKRKEAVKVDLPKAAQEAPLKAVLKAAVIAPRRVVQAELVPAAQIEAMAGQFITQLRPIVGAELRLVTSACAPSATQRKGIALEGARALKLAATKVAEIQMGLNQVAGVFSDPRKTIRESVEAAAKAQLSPEQFARYRKEADRRAKDQREAVMLNVVTNLDNLLHMSAAQRETLCASLLANWDDKVFPTLETVVAYENYFPVIPDQSIIPVLNSDQVKIWQGARKINFASIRNFNFSNNGLENGDGDEDEDLKAAIAEGVK